jgi:TadE-like protein.
MVEFALVIPIFLLVLSGILDFGFALFSRMTVINSAREGARAAVMVSDYTTIPTVVTTRVNAAAAQAGLTPTSITTTCLQTTVSVTTPPICNWNDFDATTNTSGVKAGDSVKVTVNYTYKTFFPLAFGATFNLSSTVQMTVE